MSSYVVVCAAPTHGQAVAGLTQQRARGCSSGRRQVDPPRCTPEQAGARTPGGGGGRLPRRRRPAPAPGHAPCAHPTDARARRLADAPNAQRTGRYPPLEARDGLTPAEISALWDYAAKTGVRSVKYGVYMPTVGFAASSKSGDVSSQLYWTPDAPLGASGVARAQNFSAGGVWM